MPIKKSEPTKYCPECLKFEIHTPAEWYRNVQNDFCTYHYWIIRGRDGGGPSLPPVRFSLESYVEGSKLHGFRTSLPSPEEMARMNGD
jgi:hypothetical protein